jgi:hypothetical protein
LYEIGLLSLFFSPKYDKWVNLTGLTDRV